MSEWKIRVLSDLAFYHNGMAFGPEDWSKEGLPIIRIEQLNNPESVKDWFRGNVPSESYIQKGDLIFSWSATLKVAIWNHYAGALNQHLFKVIPKAGVDKSFLFYVLDFNMDKLGESSQGSTMRHVKRKELNSFEVKVPLLPTQRRIAQILSTVDAQIEKTEQLIRKYEMVKAGMMNDLFTRGIDPKTGKLRSPYEEAPELYEKSALGWVPKEWEVLPFNNVVKLRHGYQFRDYDFVQQGIKVVKIGQLGSDGSLNLESASMISEKRLQEFEDIQIHKGDILMALTGATLGKTVRVITQKEVLVQNYRVGHFEPISAERLNKGFLYFSLITSWTQNQILGYVNSGAQGNIGKADFEKLLIKVPSLFAEQEKISKFLNIAVSYISRLEKSLIGLRKIKFGLMQDLLTGKVEVPLNET